MNITNFSPSDHVTELFNKLMGVDFTRRHLHQLCKFVYEGALELGEFKSDPSNVFLNRALRILAKLLHSSSTYKFSDYNSLALSVSINPDDLSLEERVALDAFVKITQISTSLKR